MKELHEKVVSNTSASQFDMRYGKKRKKKGPLQDEEYEATLRGFHWPPAKNCNEYTRIALFSHSHSLCVSIVCARVRKCASRLLQKCNSMAKNKTAWCITYTGCFYLQCNLFLVLSEFNIKTINIFFLFFFFKLFFR